MCVEAHYHSQMNESLSVIVKLELLSGFLLLSEENNEMKRKLIINGM